MLIHSGRFSAPLGPNCLAFVAPRGLATKHHRALARLLARKPLMRGMQSRSTDTFPVCPERLAAPAPADRGVRLALLALLMMPLLPHWFGPRSIPLLGFFFFFFLTVLTTSAPQSVPVFPQTNPAATFLASCYRLSRSPKDPQDSNPTSYRAPI